MDKLMAGRTTFVIAHRLSTIKNSDCIMVLENGRIIERGSHDQLIAEKGRYYQLVYGKSCGGKTGSVTVCMAEPILLSGSGFSFFVDKHT